MPSPSPGLSVPAAPGGRSRTTWSLTSLAPGLTSSASFSSRHRMHVPPDRMSDVTGQRENRGDDNLVSQGQTVSFVCLTIRLYNYAACHSPGVKVFWKTVTQTLCFICGKAINTTHHELKYVNFWL